MKKLPETLQYSDALQRRPARLTPRPANISVAGSGLGNGRINKAKMTGKKNNWLRFNLPQVRCFETAARTKWLNIKPLTIVSFEKTIV